MLILTANMHEIPLSEFHRRYDAREDMLQISVTIANNYTELTVYELIEELKGVTALSVNYNEVIYNFADISLDTLEEHIYDNRETGELILNFFDNTYKAIKNPDEVIIYDFHDDAVNTENGESIEE